ncbi:HAMP domain-containing sensor histidine kinase [Mycolicibacterium austroafricanum]|uniref:HAMP domain-containing sensor histidine kinase n=1 Tax=Mycolicibacterium austroafricanum TaxID=39687 RepID=UPI001CA3288C|nr:ATP-binding protein [Mycolicibacterium austroafricanum]QZT63531.1 HAMP domain-containing protein [Mycolicibacterium austroafricanum]
MNDTRSVKRPAPLALSNWPVRVKVLAIVVVPLLLACVFGGLRIYSSATEAAELRHAAQRADMVPAVVDYMAALEAAMVTATEGGDARQALTVFESRRTGLDHLLDVTPVDDGVRLAINTLIDFGQNLIDKISADAIDLRTRVMTYAPLLITSETAITGLVGADDETVRSDADTLSRAVGARGQMAMQRMLVNSGAQLPEPLLRSAMVTIAGTEPATVTAMGGYLGGATEQATTLRSEMVKRMALLSEPTTALVGNPELLASQKITGGIAAGLIAQTTDDIPAAMARQAHDARTAAIRDAALVGAAILVALILVTLVARSMVRPLRTLRDSALKVAHEDLAREVEHVRSDGKEFPVQPIPVHTTEEVGQVAHAVDELHQQAVMLAGEQARLQLQVTDMFETLSRRNRSLVDQQLSLIDRLERDEEDPDRLESLFRLDHLAARMRRNGSNLMVLAGAQISRERAESVPVTALVNAAASEVEDYTRIVTTGLPDCEVDGVVAGDLVHLLAELLDNALRYSPPTTQVRVSAVPTGNNGLVIEVSDTGLGMTESDLRVANTRLESGGEVNPYTARHMGLFVVGRLAASHGLVVRLRSTVAGEPDSGTTAGVYIPARLLIHTAPAHYGGRDDAPVPADAHAGIATALALDVPAGVTPEVPAAGPTTDLLPQRRPGASGIVETPAVPSPPAVPPPPVETSPPPVETPPARSEVAAFFSPRPQPPETNGHARHAAVDSDPDDAIYQKMLSEWLVDPHELSHSTDLNWKSVWDHGWSAAEAADAAPVLDHTAEGLPVRRPGARLVPGHADDEPVASAGRDPEAVRNSIGSHFGGVHAGRLRAQETGGADFP